MSPPVHPKIKAASDATLALSMRCGRLHGLERSPTRDEAVRILRLLADVNTAVAELCAMAVD